MRLHRIFAHEQPPMLRDQIEYNEFCRRGQKQQKSRDACAGMPETRLVRRVNGRLTRLPASLEGPCGLTGYLSRRLTGKSSGF
jgi:hypothetical protein